MTKGYAVSLGFGVLGIVFLTILFDSYRLMAAGGNPNDSVGSPAIVALVIAAVVGYGARLIFVSSLSLAVRVGLRAVVSVVMVAIIVATVGGFILLATGTKVDNSTLGFATLSSISALLWLLRYNHLPAA